MKVMHYIRNEIFMIIFSGMFLLCDMNANAQQIIKSSDTNDFRIGDSIYYDFVDASKISAINPTGSLWDFSNLKYLGQEKAIRFVSDREGCIRMIGQDEILDFCQSNDYLRLSQIQTPLLKVDFGDSFSYLNYPFSVTDSVACNLDGRGIYSSRNKFRLLGKNTAKAMGKGKIILPSNDSLPNTLLIQRNVRGDIFLSKDSVEPGSQSAKLLLEVETNEWYSQGYRYPVFKTLQATLWNGKQAIMRRQYACAANMENFADLMDEENAKLREKQQDVSLNKSSASSLIDYHLAMDGKKLTIVYSLSGESQLHFVLSNTSGMLLKSVNQHQPAGNGYRQVIDLGNLPSGEYVLYINVNDQKFSEKVSIEN